MLKAARPLLASGFRLTDSYPDDREAFGNAMIELTSDDLIVTFAVDRSPEIRVAFRWAPWRSVDLRSALDACSPGRRPSTDAHRAAAEQGSPFEEAALEILRNRDALADALRPSLWGWLRRRW
jgi:hypothetical protein